MTPDDVSDGKRNSERDHAVCGAIMFSFSPSNTVRTCSFYELIGGDNRSGLAGLACGFDRIDETPDEQDDTRDDE